MVGVGWTWICSHYRCIVGVVLVVEWVDVVVGVVVGHPKVIAMVVVVGHTRGHCYCNCYYP